MKVGVEADWYGRNFSLKLVLKSFIVYKGDLNKTIKFVCVAMYSLVMSLHSRDLLIIITQRLVFRW